VKRRGGEEETKRRRDEETKRRRDEETKRRRDEETKRMGDGIIGLERPARLQDIQTIYGINIFVLVIYCL